MNDLNSLVVIGRITRDTETKYTNNGTAVCKLSIASNYRKKLGTEWKDETNYFDATLFGRDAENLGKFLTKGQQVALSGELRQDRWEENGAKRSKMYIVIADIQLLGKKPAQDGDLEPSDEDIPF